MYPEMTFLNDIDNYLPESWYLHHLDEHGRAIKIGKFGGTCDHHSLTPGKEAPENDYGYLE